MWGHLSEGKLYDPAYGQMRVVGLMSGSGTNLVKIIEHEKKLENERGRNHSPYHVAVIFSDNVESNAAKIGKQFDLPVIIRDITAFYAARNKPRKDMHVRGEFDRETVKALEKFECHVAAYAGYMAIASPVLIDAFLGVNVHPADLTIRDIDGKPEYIGDHAVRDAIMNGEEEIRSTTHIVTRKVDCGPILMVSEPLAIKYPISDDIIDEAAKTYQNALKENGDWVIFPKTLEYLAEGVYEKKEDGKLYLAGKEILQKRDN